MIQYKTLIINIRTKYKKRYHNMNQIFPLQIQHKFKCTIISYELINKKHSTFYYNCSTNFGKMTLIIEQANYQPCQSLNMNYRYLDTKIGSKQYFQFRNSILSKSPFSFYMPLIYQQYIITIHKDRSICLTLTQQTQSKKFFNLIQDLNHQNKINLLLALYHLQILNSPFGFHLDYQKLQSTQLLESILTKKVYFDFTVLKYNNTEKQSMSKNVQIKALLNTYCLLDNQKAKQFQNIKQIIIIKQHVFKFQKKNIQSQDFKSWFQAAIAFNFLRQTQVYIKTKQKDIKQQIIQKNKITQIKNINTMFKHGQNIQFYQGLDTQSINNLNFQDGFCTNLLKQLTYQQLISQFFIDESIYILRKDIYLTVQRLQKQQQFLYSKKRSKKQDIIYIQFGVSKYQCINFFITYFKFIDPLLKVITFNQQQNQLEFQYIGKFKVQRKLTLIFYSAYLIKDEEVSMIIQKSKIQTAILNLSKMELTDSFLMFLANSQKMTKIKSLDISYCPKISQHGVNSLLISPFCKNLQTINVSGAPIISSSIQSLLNKTNLKQLYMNNCSKLQYHDENILILKNVKLNRLQAIGMNIQLSFTQNIQYIKIDFEISVQYLKLLKDFHLKELSIKLIQQKKNLIGGFLNNINNFYLKQNNPVKSFVQGKSSKTLKKLDLSSSSIKIKNFKQMFNMPELQYLKLENMHNNPQQIDFAISPKILDFSIRNSWIGLKQIINLLKNTKIMIKLNISSSILKKQQVVQLFSYTKKHINTLIISQDQYSQNLIHQQGKAIQFVQTFQIITTQQYLLKDKNQQIINNMLLKIYKSNKNVKFKPNTQNYDSSKLRNGNKAHHKFENILFKSIRRFSKKFHLQLAKNVFINNKPFLDCQKDFRLRKKQQSKNNCDQFICVHQAFKKPKIVSLSAQNFIPKYSQFTFKKKYNLFQLQQSAKYSQAYSLQRQQNYLFQNQNQQNQISHLTYLYKRTLQQYQNELIDVSIKKNKLIDCSNAVQMMINYFPELRIKSIDLRSTTLNHNNDYLNKVIQIPFLESFNHNQYQLRFQQKNFIQMSQKYLKFFMRIGYVKKLKVISKSINQVDILFSILYHIVQNHDQSIEQLICQFQSIKISKQNSQSFWIKMTQLKKLKHLSLKFNHCKTEFLKHIFQRHQLNSFNHLQSLNIEGMDCQSIPILKQTDHLKLLTLNLQNSQTTQSDLLKILKPIGNSLKHLQLNLDICSNITYPNKLFGKLSAFHLLQTFKANFQYCPIKQLSTLDFLQNIYNFKNLQQCQINLSFSSIGLAEISNILNNFHLKLPLCHFSIYLIGCTQSKDAQFNKESLQNKGIQVVL